MSADRFERLVRRIAEWTDNEVAVVCPRQTRHVAQVVVAGADPVYPSFAPEELPDTGMRASTQDLRDWAMELAKAEGGSDTDMVLFRLAFRYLDLAMAGHTV